MTGLEFAAVALAGVLIGRFLPNRRKGPKPPEPPEPVCGCDHHHSYHDPAKGECHGQVYIDGSRGVYGTAKYKPCTCRQYSGPQPMPEFFAQEVTS